MYAPQAVEALVPRPVRAPKALCAGNLPLFVLAGVGQVVTDFARQIIQTTSWGNIKFLHFPPALGTDVPRTLPSLDGLKLHLPRTTARGADGSDNHRTTLPLVPGKVFSFPDSQGGTVFDHYSVGGFWPSHFHPRCKSTFSSSANLTFTPQNAPSPHPRQLV